MLSTDELNFILKENAVTRRLFLGTYPSCVIPETNKRTYCFISNTDDHLNPGVHWNAWFVRDGKVSFFDSFGRSYRHVDFPEYYKLFASRFDEINYSTTQIQSKDSWMCGYFCVHFLYSQCLGVDFENFLDQYSSDFDQNDCKVLDFVDSIL